MPKYDDFQFGQQPRSETRGETDSGQSSRIPEEPLLPPPVRRKEGGEKGFNLVSLFNSACISFPDFPPPPNPHSSPSSGRKSGGQTYFEIDKPVPQEPFFAPPTSDPSQIPRPPPYSSSVIADSHHDQRLRPINEAERPATTHIPRQSGPGMEHDLLLSLDQGEHAPHNGMDMFYAEPVEMQEARDRGGTNEGGGREDNRSALPPELSAALTPCRPATCLPSPLHPPASSHLLPPLSSL
eukprot:2927289-Rhodomonas_salina.1